MLERWKDRYPNSPKAHQEQLARVLQDWLRILEYELPSASTPAEFKKLLRAQGLAIVPIEPTSAMLNAGYRELRDNPVNKAALPRPFYKAMLAAHD